MSRQLSAIHRPFPAFDFRITPEGAGFLAPMQVTDDACLHPPEGVDGTTTACLTRQFFGTR